MNFEAQKILSSINLLDSNLLLDKEKSFEILGISPIDKNSYSNSLKISDNNIQDLVNHIGVIPEEI